MLFLFSLSILLPILSPFRSLSSSFRHLLLLSLVPLNSSYLVPISLPCTLEFNIYHPHPPLCLSLMPFRITPHAEASFDWPVHPTNHHPLFNQPTSMQLEIAPGETVPFVVLPFVGKRGGFVLRGAEGWEEAVAVLREMIGGRRSIPIG